MAAVLTGAQGFDLYLRKTAGTPNPISDIQLYENGSFVATLMSSVSITSTTGQLVTAPWNASQVSAENSGAGIECRVVSTPGQSADEPGALPAYNSSGTFLTNATMPATRDVVVPAHSSGDLLILVVGMRNTNSGNRGVLATINTADWEQLGGAGNTYGGNQIATLGVGWKIGNGSETVVSITTTGGTTSDGIYARVHCLTAANGFAATPVQNISAATTGATPIGMPTVAVPSANCRAVVAVMIDQEGVFSAPTGESGGSWAIDVQDPSGTGADGAIGLLSSDQSGGGTISGGTMAFTLATVGVAVGFAVVPASIPGAAVNTVEVGAIEWNAQYVVTGVSASGDGAAAAASGSGGASSSTGAAGTPSTTPATASGTATVPVTAEGAPEAPATTATGDAAGTVSGAGSQTSPAVSGTGDGAAHASGSGSETTAPATATGDGTAAAAADGAPNVGAVTGSGTAGSLLAKVDVELWQDGAFVATLLDDVEVTDEAGQLLEGEFDASILTGGQDIEVRIVSAVAGVDIGAVRWDALVSPSGEAHASGSPDVSPATATGAASTEAAAAGTVTTAVPGALGAAGAHAAAAGSGTAPAVTASAGAASTAPQSAGAVDAPATTGTGTAASHAGASGSSTAAPTTGTGITAAQAAATGAPSTAPATGTGTAGAVVSAAGSGTVAPATADGSAVLLVHEDVLPTTVLASSNLQDSALAAPPVLVSDLDEDPTSPDGLDWTAINIALPVEARVGFPAPASGTATGQQTIRIRLRKAA